MKSYIKPVIAGILLAFLVLKTAFLFASPISYQLFVLFFAYTACTYFGAALSDSRVKWISIEFLMSFVFFLFAGFALLYSPVWLAFGFILHGIWDMLHHPKIIQTKVVKWFPPFCAIFDWIIAAYLLSFY